MGLDYGLACAWHDRIIFCRIPAIFKSSNLEPQASRSQASRQFRLPGQIRSAHAFDLKLHGLEAEFCAIRCPGCLIVAMGFFLKLGVPSWGPYNKDHSILGSILGSSNFGQLPY